MTRIGRSKGSVAGAVAGLLVLLTGLTASAQAPKAERPTYAVGDKWIRSDGAYDLIRVENGRYVFAADGGREVHLTRDLGVAKIVRAGQVLLELEPPPGLAWPLDVGQSGVSWLTLRSLDPQFGQSLVRLTWKVDASQDVRVPAGVFKAFRIVQVLEPRFLAVSPQSRRLELTFWYAPAVQQLVRADGNDLSGLAFQAVALDRPVVAALAVALTDPKDQGRVATERITLTGKVTGGTGLLRIAVTLNGAEIARQQEPGTPGPPRAGPPAGPPPAPAPPPAPPPPAPPDPRAPSRPPAEPPRGPTPPPGAMSPPPAAPAPATVVAVPPESAVRPSATFRITISTPTNQARVEQESVTFAAVVYGGTGVRQVLVTANGVELFRQDNRTQQPSMAVNLPVKLAEGQNTLVVTAAETDGTMHQEMRTIHHEKLVPLAVDVRYPEDRSRVTDEASVVAAGAPSGQGTSRAPG